MRKIEVTTEELINRTLKKYVKKKLDIQILKNWMLQ